jgi:hypothetical protein
MKVSGKIVGANIDFKTGKPTISFEINEKHDFGLMVDELKDCDKLSIEVKQYREKRSLNANAYAWVLIGKIADVLRASKDEIYFDMLKAYGQGGAVSVEEKYVEDFKRSYKYHEILGESQLNGKTFVHFRFWVGSSEYDTKEMSILIDGVVKEAKNLDIETMTPEELKSLMEAENVRRTV